MNFFERIKYNRMLYLASKVEFGSKDTFGDYINKFQRIVYHSFFFNLSNIKVFLWDCDEYKKLDSLKEVLSNKWLNYDILVVEGTPLEPFYLALRDFLVIKFPEYAEDKPNDFNAKKDKIKWTDIDNSNLTILVEKAKKDLEMWEV